MATKSLLDTELMYLTEECTSVATTVGAVDRTRLSTDQAEKNRPLSDYDAG